MLFARQSVDTRANVALVLQIHRAYRRRHISYLGKLYKPAVVAKRKSPSLSNITEIFGKHNSSDAQGFVILTEYCVLLRVFWVLLARAVVSMALYGDHSIVGSNAHSTKFTAGYLVERSGFGFRNLCNYKRGVKFIWI